MGKVRPFVREDIPQVVDLHPRAFEDSNRPPSAYFEEVFFRNPWFDEAMPSLVYERDKDNIVGFLGVVPRRLSFKRQTVQAAIASHFMVEPHSRSTMAGLKLLKTFLAGPQDLSISDTVSYQGRKVWEVFSGQTAWIYSLRWKRTLRPTPIRCGQSVLRQWRPLIPVAIASKFVGSILDVVAEQTRGRRFRPVAPGGSELEIDESTMIAHLPRFVGAESLHPEYDDCSLKWLLDRAAGKKQHGKLQKIGVRNISGEFIGWYIYYLKPGAGGQVLQIAAKQSSISEVLDSLFSHAWRGRANGLYGRLVPSLINALAETSSISCDCSKYGMMVHARNPELLSVIHSGDAFLSQLEGEWATGFHGEAFK